MSKMSLTSQSVVHQQVHKLCLVAVTHRHGASALFQLYIHMLSTSLLREAEGEAQVPLTQVLLQKLSQTQKNKFIRCDFTLTPYYLHLTYDPGTS